jgi:hypothetical protein
MSLKQELVTEAIKATPATSTLTLTLFGVPFSQWAAVLSCTVLILQLIFLIYNQATKKRGTNADNP